MQYDITRDPFSTMFCTGLNIALLEDMPNEESLPEELESLLSRDTSTLLEQTDLNRDVLTSKARVIREFEERDNESIRYTIEDG